jgi:hypothetical protein
MHDGRSFETPIVVERVSGKCCPGLRAHAGALVPVDSGAPDASAE